MLLLSFIDTLVADFRHTVSCSAMAAPSRHKPGVWQATAKARTCVSDRQQVGTAVKPADGPPAYR